MRLIDADALKEDYLWCKSESTPWDYTWDAAMERVDMQPTIQPESAKWISVKDRMPTESGQYLAFIRPWQADGYMEVCGYDADKKEFGDIDMDYAYADDGWYSINDVTHWQELPEPPEGGDAHGERQQVHGG